MGRRAKDNSIDWELVEKEYRLGQLSLRQIATQFGIQASAISRKAKKEGWVHDKLAEVIALSQNQLILSNTHKATPNKEDIEIAATVRTNKVLEHRVDINRFRGLAIKLLTELEITSDSVELFEQLGELLVDTADEDTKDAQAKRVEIFNRALTTSSRIDSAKKLAETLKVLITMEREAYGISEATKLDVNANVTNHFAPLATDWATFKAKVLEKARLH